MQMDMIIRIVSMCISIAALTVALVALKRSKK
nr:MAG TPA: hypothetical protein [Caudoviricetes sp.]